MTWPAPVSTPADARAYGRWTDADEDEAMSATGLEVFDTTLQKTHSFLNDLMRVMDWQDRQKAYLATRATLHALRDRLTVPEVVQLGAQLPMLVRGFYYEGWRPDGAHLKERHKEQFLSKIAEYFRNDPEADPERIARGVFLVLASRVAAGEIEDVKGVLPAELRTLWP
jgi:uncharacterized protein (DUF2267 family)